MVFNIVLWSSLDGQPLQLAPLRFFQPLLVHVVVFNIHAEESVRRRVHGYDGGGERRGRETKSMRQEEECEIGSYKSERERRDDKKI